MMNQTRASLDWLRGAEGARLLEDLAAAGPASWSDPSYVTSLRRRCEAATATLALRLAEARKRAAARFPDADRLFFTPELLEQASAHPVAAWRARRFAEAGGAVLDLGCGAGGDLTRLALAGLAVTGLERDGMGAALARANLESLGLAGEVIHGEFPGATLPAHELLFADPARRRGARRPGGSGRGGRLGDPSLFSPAPRDLHPALDAAEGWCVKWGPSLDLSPEAMTAPGALLDGLDEDGYELELVSWKGEVREALFWGGSLRRARRAATVLRGGPEPFTVHRFQGEPEPPPKIRAEGDYVFEPDGALIRSGLLNAYARRHGLTLLAGGIAYLSGDRPPVEGLVRSFPRLESFDFSLARLQEALDRHDAGDLVLKKRGFPEAPESLRRRLRLSGSQRRIVLIHRQKEGHRAHLCSDEEDFFTNA